ncbi:hypothetical protein D9758_015779 [Tetrapyrgos nigripes]|uniref:Uncharacterized protein n=1 Tax=Tetrapyrgos nigripes TaxID=182062 RepID=A0A8H5C3I7_9AGAR|nr:hypothetical protein D9758_015779 [Tetrapyrgos nigripes]
MTTLTQETDSSPAHPGPFPFDPGFDIQSVASLAVSLPSHSWEFGTASEALLELYNPELAVFGEDPFGLVPPLSKAQGLGSNRSQSNSNFPFKIIPSLTYASSKITLNLSSNAGANVLSDGDGATGDPASLGVSAVLLGRGLGFGFGQGGKNKTWIFEFREGARRTMEYLVGGAPRYANGAISQRADVAELWADFVYMAPPFLAYYAVSTSNLSLLLDTVDQCGFYRQILQLGSPSDVEDYPPSPTDALNGLWRHIIGPQSSDPGLWSTGNAWAAAGMTRILATVVKAPKELFQSPIRYPSTNISASSNSSSLVPSNLRRTTAISVLTTYIKEILDGVIFAAPLDNGLLRNYLNETLESGHGYGEISGSSLLASVVYRMIILRPDVFLDLPADSDSGKNWTTTGSAYLDWADGIRHTIGSEGYVSSNGTVAPAVNPLDWGSTVPYTAGSPEGQNFVVLMYAAWRDCVLEGLCQEN